MDKIYLILLIPFLGTALGSATVFFMKNKMNSKLEKFLSGFASGVMIAASIWSLLIPSTDMAKEQGLIEWVPASIGFLCGIAFLLVLDSIIPHLHVKSNKPEGIKSILTIFLTGAIEPILPYLLSFAAGAMIYVVVEELIPDAQSGEHSNLGVIGVSIGFVIMMILDIALG